MNPTIRYLLRLLPLMLLLFAGAVQAEPPKSLRGDVGPEELNPPPANVKLEQPQGGFARAYRQSPPLVPHRVEGYQVTMDNNQCMACHDWPNNIKFQAPKISETHYRDREGRALDRVAGTRWFCPACHVPQADAKELVRNVFEDATRVK